MHVFTVQRGLHAQATVAAHRPAHGTHPLRDGPTRQRAARTIVAVMIAIGAGGDHGAREGVAGAGIVAAQVRRGNRTEMGGSSDEGRVYVGLAHGQTGPDVASDARSIITQHC